VVVGHRQPRRGLVRGLQVGVGLVERVPAPVVGEADDLGTDVLAFRRGPVMVVLNCGEAAVELPAGELLLASGPVDDGKLAGDTAAWLR
jgi:hypothetical protein